MKPSTWADIEPLFDKEYKALAAFAAREVGPTAAEDVVQAAYVRLAEAVERGGVREPKKVLWQAVRNLTSNHKRDERDIIMDNTTIQGLAEARAGGIEGSLFSAAFNVALERLSADDRSAFVLCELRGLTQDEASEVLGIDQATVSRRYEAARAALARELA